ncbi:CHITINASE [Salix koriyanagi]|uniref:CHITINASE n=1 Tax=Salix koriyanagi TaxID=2511006 RepID=A0A9Q0ZTB1_9ROSI|nr:CHITINASE [Salix koriyanagi]
MENVKVEKSKPGSIKCCHKFDIVPKFTDYIKPNCSLCSSIKPDSSVQIWLPKTLPFFLTLLFLLQLHSSAGQNAFSSRRETEARFSTFTRTVQQKNPSVKTLLSIGGGDANATYFDGMASQAVSRKSFIDSSIRLARSNNFHGLDLDWEYPSNATQMTNFGLLLAEWRVAVAKESRRSRNTPLLLSAAVFRSSDYYTINYPISAVSKSLDWINVMAYDFYGAAISKEGDIGYAQINNFIAQNGARALYNSSFVSNFCYSGTTWIGYDDKESISAKVIYAKNRGLLGYFAWHAGVDDKWALSRQAASAWGA